MPRETSTRTAILAAAYYCFTLYGYEECSLRRIASMANVGVSLISYQFKSKEGIWRAVVQELQVRQAPYIEEIKALHAPELDSEKALRQLFHILFRYADEFPEYHALVSREILLETERAKELLESIIKPFFNAIATIINKGIENNLLSKGDPYTVSIMLYSGLATARLIPDPQIDEKLETIVFNLIRKHN